MSRRGKYLMCDAMSVLTERVAELEAENTRLRDKAEASDWLLEIEQERGDNVMAEVARLRKLLREVRAELEAVKGGRS